MSQHYKCYPSDVSMKSLFLGPKAENGHWLLEQMVVLLNEWFLWRQKQNPHDGSAVTIMDQNLREFVRKQKNVAANLKHLSALFENEIPQFSPRYIGHMFSEVNLPAMLGHFVSLLHNPNIISHESAKVGIKIENEAIGYLNQMIGFKGTYGHFTSGGTVANFEALVRSKERIFLWALMLAVENRVHGKNESFWRCSALGWERFDSLLKNKKIRTEFNYLFSQLKSSEDKRLFFKEEFSVAQNDPVILIPDHKHYSWVKGCALIGLNSEQVRYLKLDENGKIDLKELYQSLVNLKRENRPIQQVVSVLGTTELGFVDPIHGVLEVLKRTQLKCLWYHVDAAYGGFFASLKEQKQVFNKQTLTSLLNLKKVTSVTIDPHKMGYVPYSSGAFLCSAKKDYYLQSFFGPYVAYNKNIDRGPFTLEGSRPATGATAMWMTAKSIPLNATGMGKIISRTLRSKLDIEKLLRKTSSNIRLAHGTDLNIVCFCIADKGDSIVEANKKTQQLLMKFQKKSNFIVSKTSLKFANYGKYIEKYSRSWAGGDLSLQKNKDLLLVRVTIMNPFFDSQEFKLNFKSEFVNFVAANL